jgi:hypothetical protein
MSLVNIVPNSVLVQQEQAAAIAKADAEASRQPLLDSLASHVRRCFDAARNARQSAGSGTMRSLDNQLLSALRARQGEYEPEKLVKIRQFGGSEAYARITSTKIRGAAAWIKDIYLNNTNEKPWTLKPTPDPELVNNYKEQAELKIQQDAQLLAQYGIEIPPENAQMMRDMLLAEAQTKAENEAKEACARMENRIQDQMLEGGAYSALADFIDNLVTFKTAILEAPIVRRKRQIKWVNGTPTLQDELVYEFDAVNPLDFYPAPGIGHVNEGFVIRRHRRLTRRYLHNLIGVPGYSEANIRAVLDEQTRGGLRNWLQFPTDTEREKLESKNYWDDPEDTFDALEYSGSVQGKTLLDWGLEEGVEDELAEYDVNVWVIGGYTIKAQLNPDPLNRKKYYTTSVEKIPGSIWGNSIHDLIEDCQDVCNSAMRALINNMGIASGPQVWVNVDRLPPGEKITQMYPWKVWQTTTDPMGSSAPPAEFFQPNSNATELMAVFEKFYAMADDISGIPRYMIGNEKVGGAGRTASGLGMLMDAANKLLKLTLANIDRDVIQPLIETLFTYNMLYNPDPSVKGDVQVVARGAVSLAQKELTQQRRNEFLQATANPFDLQILGMPGRAAILRETAKGLDMPVDNLIPDHVKLQQMQAMQDEQNVQQEAQPDEETSIERDEAGQMTKFKTKRKGAPQ